MSDYNAEDVRNIALVGHAGSGKTTLVEALLAATGVINVPGNVTKGTTVCDFDPMEKELQHSLDAAITSFTTSGKHINLIDTPAIPISSGAVSRCCRRSRPPPWSSTPRPGSSP
jgi:elongation factor G